MNLRPLPGLERALGDRLPSPMRRFFSAPSQLKHLQRPIARKVDALDRLYPKLPLRVLPVFSTFAGNELGLYLPRSEAPSFAVAFYKDEYTLSPLTGHLGRFFRNPDYYSHDHPVHEGNAPPADWDCARLQRISLKARCAEFELLKPLYFHYRDLERCAEGVFKNLWTRFGSEVSRAKLIRKAFRSPGDLHDRRAWLKLSESFAGSECWEEAIRSLENCHAIQSVVGYTMRGQRKYHSLSWKDDLEVFERLAP